MRKATAVVAGMAALLGGGFAFYRFGLSDEDRRSISDMVAAARNLFDEARSMVEPAAAQTARSAEAEHIANREDTRRQWAELGY